MRTCHDCDWLHSDWSTIYDSYNSYEETIKVYVCQRQNKRLDNEDMYNAGDCRDYYNSQEERD